MPKAYPKLVNLATIHEFKSALAMAIARGTGVGVVADLTGVEFAEVLTLNALMRTRDLLGAATGELLLVYREGSPMHRLLETAAEVDGFPTYRELAPALGATKRPVYLAVRPVSRFTALDHCQLSDRGASPIAGFPRANWSGPQQLSTDPPVPRLPLAVQISPPQ